MSRISATRALGSESSRVVAGMIVVAMFAWGTAFYGLGFYLLRLYELKGWSLTAISNVVLVFYLAAVVLSFWISKQLARRGPRPVMTLGALTTGAALVAMPHVNSLALLVPVYLLLSVGWSATNTNPISTTILAWYPNGQRQLSIALVGASLGGTILIPLLGQLDQRFGFTTAMTVLGVVTIIAVGAVAQTVIDRPPQDDLSTDGPGKRADQTAWGITRAGDFWIIAGALALSIAVQGGFLVHQLSILSTVVSAQAAAKIVGITTIAAFVGRFGPVIIGDRAAPALVGAFYLTIQGVALAVLGFLEHTATVLTAMSLFFGLGVGVLITMPSLLTRNTYPDLAYTSAYPVVNLAFQLPLAAGAPALAMLHDHLGGYQPSMWILAIADLLAAILLGLNHLRTTGRSITKPQPNDAMPPRTLCPDKLQYQA